MLYICVQRFDVTRNLEKFYKILGTKHSRIAWTRQQNPPRSTSCPHQRLSQSVVGAFWETPPYGCAPSTGATRQAAPESPHPSWVYVEQAPARALPPWKQSSAEGANQLRPSGVRIRHQTSWLKMQKSEYDLKGASVGCLAGLAFPAFPRP
jgi:hypothetical protein